MILELTEEQVDLLKEILVGMIGESDWTDTAAGYKGVYVLMDKDNQLAEKIDIIYSKLF